MALNLPKKPKQSLWDKVKDTFDANTEADQQRRIAQGKPQMYKDEVAQRKGLLPRLYGQQQVGLQNDLGTFRQQWRTGESKPGAITELLMNRTRGSVLGVPGMVATGISGSANRYKPANDALQGLGTGIMNTSLPRVVGGGLEYTGRALNKPAITKRGESISNPFREYNNEAYNNANNKALFQGSQMAGTLLGSSVNPSGKAGVVTNALRFGLPSAGDTSKAIQDAGGSRTQQIIGGGASGLNQAIMGNLLKGKGTGVKKFLTSAGAGATENVTQQFIDNLIAQKTYQQDRKLNEGLGTAFVTGGAVSGATNIPSVLKRKTTPQRTPIDYSDKQNNRLQAQRAYDVETNPVLKRQISEYIAKLNQSGTLGDAGNTPTVKNVFGQEVPNPNYKDPLESLKQEARTTEPIFERDINTGKMKMQSSKQASKEKYSIANSDISRTKNPGMNQDGFTVEDWGGKKRFVSLDDASPETKMKVRKAEAEFERAKANSTGVVAPGTKGPVQIAREKLNDAYSDAIDDLKLQDYATTENGGRTFNSKYNDWLETKYKDRNIDSATIKDMATNPQKYRSQFEAETATQSQSPKPPLANDAPQIGKQPTQKPVVSAKAPKTTQVSSIAQGRAVEAPVKPTSKEAFVPGEAKPVVNLKQTDALPTRMKGGTGPEYQRDMNVKNYDLPEEDLKVLSDLSGKSVKRMKNTDIQEAAQFVGVDTTNLSDREMLAVLAGRLNQSKETTSRVAQIGELKKAGATEDQIRQAIADARKSIEIDQNQKTFAGRQLQMERIIKSKLSPEDKFIRMLVTSGADPDKIDNTLLNLDLSTPEAAVRAWREAVPATLENWLDKYRYTNMLSSPLTHVVNIVGNLQSTAGVRPLTIAVTGALDAAKSVVSGKPRAQFAGEAPRYLKGAVQNVSKAVDEAIKSMTRFGEYAKNPDMIGDFDTPLAVDGIKGKADAAISFIPKLLNAGDIFFKTIAEGGETAALNYRASKGAFTGDVAEQAAKNADYTLFRAKLGEKEQGYLLQALDFLPQSINRARNSDSVIVRNIAKATFPFVSTPTNIFKQGIEYSPAGFLTMAGNRDKTAQAAKALMGTTAVAMAAGTFAANDAITGAEPSDKAQRDAFRAEGKQPWSVKIGDKWVQYSKLHPAIAFNLATVAAVKDAMDKGTIDQDGADKVMSMVGGVLGFYRDQSYFKGIGDFTNMIQGVDTSSIGDTASSVIGSTASQYLPLQSFNNWVGRLINDTQTKVDYSADFVQQTLQRLFKDYPAGGEMTGAPERENPYTGGPIQVENRGINAFSPLRVTNDKGFGNTTGLNVDERQMMQDAPNKEQFRQDVMQQKGAERLDKKLKTEMADTDAEIRQGATGKFYAKLDGKVTSFDTKEKADIAVAKDKFAKSDKNFEIVGETVFRKSATGEVTTTPKIKYDTDLTWAELTKHKNADNLDAWMTSAEKQLQNLEKQLQDPNIDELDRIKIENSAQGLIKDIVKYSDYAGFTKGKSGSGGRGGSGSGSINATQFLSGAPQTRASVRPTVSAKSTAKYRVAKRSTAKPTVTVRKSKV